MSKSNGYDTENLVDHRYFKWFGPKPLLRWDRVIGTFAAAQIDAFNDLYQNKAIGIKLDLTNLAEIQHAFEWVSANFGKLDVLVNNAGLGFAGAIEETSDEESRAVFEANFFGVLASPRLFSPCFANRKVGTSFKSLRTEVSKHLLGLVFTTPVSLPWKDSARHWHRKCALGIQLTIVEPDLSGRILQAVASNC